MNTPDLLTAFETCDRKGFYSLSWAKRKPRSSEMVEEAINMALLAPEPPDEPLGEMVGSAVMQIAEDRGLDSSIHGIFDSVVHHAALADLLISVIRKRGEPPWLVPEGVPGWIPRCFISPDGQYLRRIAIMSTWSESRHLGECRSWRTLGEIAHLGLPMQMIVCVIGQERDGLRTGSPLTSGFLHPLNHELRFRKRSKGTRIQGNVFNEKWEKIRREDHAEISRETWLEAMMRDDVLNEVCFREDVPLPPEVHLTRVRDMAKRKLERLHALTEKPEANLSSCEWPVPCPFRKCCHVLPEVNPEEKYGFVHLNSSS